MSNPTDNPTVQEDGDDSMLFVDGFSIIDDINANGKPPGAAKDDTATGKDSTDDKIAEDVNSNEVVSDKELTEEVPKKIIENIEDEVEKSSKIDTSKENEPETLNQSNTKETKTGTFETTLVISNDEDLGSESLVSKNESINQVEIEKNQENTKTVTNKVSMKKKNTESSFVWISNITKQVKASSLKKHFSECGKVSTAKVVTNGKVFFGYVEFENSEYASRCVKTMNNTILNGKKILVSRSRPDVTKKSAPPSARKPAKTSDPEPKDEKPLKSEEKPKTVKVEPKTSSDEKKHTEDREKKVDTKSMKEKKPKGESKKTNEDNKKPNEDAKKPPNEDSKKLDAHAKKKAVDDKKKDKKESQPTKVDNDLRLKLNDSRKRMEKLRVEVERSQIEIRNLRRRLGNEQKKCVEEVKRGEKYRLEVHALTDQLKQVRSDFEKEMHRLTKKHKLELEKGEYHRSTLMMQKVELNRRQESLDKKLEEAKKMFQHMKRSRKSRSPSPPSKRFRDREGMFSGHRSPPPPPKLSSEGRSKSNQDRPVPFYEDKKARAIYDRLGDYGEKSFPKDANGSSSSSSRHRSAYPGDVVVGINKSPWSQQPVETWKKPNTSSTFLKPYMERYANTHVDYQATSTTYYPSEHSDYSKHGHYESSRKY